MGGHGIMCHNVSNFSISYALAHFLANLSTLQDIFIRFEMWRFSENSIIFSDRQNFGRRNRICHIIF